MRSFIIACAIVVLILTLVICNGIYVKNRCEHMLLAVDSLKQREDLSPELLFELNEYWADCKFMINLSIPLSEGERFESALLDANTAVTLDEEDLYRLALDKMSYALNILCDYEKFSLETTV